MLLLLLLLWVADDVLSQVHSSSRSSRSSCRGGRGHGLQGVQDAGTLVVRVLLLLGETWVAVERGGLMIALQTHLA